MSRAHGHQAKRRREDRKAFERVRDARDNKAKRARQERDRIREVAQTE